MVKQYDIAVIGGGHAGAEAAWAAAKMGCSVALVAMRAETIGRMSCNPAVGGIGKGQIVREIDALGGLMALATDRGGIQFRILNRSKGPAVWAPRAQVDRGLYAAAVQEMLAGVAGLDLLEGTVERLIVDEASSSFDHSPLIRHSRVVGIGLQDGREFRCRAVILATGTFLRGLMHCGRQQTAGGRIGEPAALALSGELARLGFMIGRLKTGTPPRVHRDSIDYAYLIPQPGDDPPVPFSHQTDRINRPQIQCWITRTNPRTHDLIRANLHCAPMYSGQIQSRGPRYCPSIEDKVVRFADKTSHQIFLEPEGYDSEWVYCNGISTSLPAEVQEDMVRSIEGLEHGRIVQHGYAVEYDWAPTDQIDSTLETKRVGGLYLAGQINGTSGYEEAAGQGLLAGVNAAAKILGREPVVLGRDEGYIGVMIDDIVTRPPDEPYRMFTSRAEYRLRLRSDNADTRLTPLGRRLGLVGDFQWSAFERKQAAVTALHAWLAKLRLDGQPLIEHLRQPESSLAALCAKVPELAALTTDPQVVEEVEIQARYAGYLAREQRLVDRYRQLEARSIPESFDYAAIPGLRFEAREKFTRVRPRNIGQAGRISGISPADVATLYIHLTRRP